MSPGSAPQASPELAGTQRRRLRHDIHHELATISLLASLIAMSDDVGEPTRARATQLGQEMRWLAELLQAYEDIQADPPSGTQRLRLDIHHELTTISLLASLIGMSDDVGEPSRARAIQLVGETRWLAELLQAYEDVQADPATPSPAPPTERLRVDLATEEVVAALRLTHPTRVDFEAAEAWTHANRLDLWRVLRNVLGNAFRAAGPQGCVRVRVATDAGAALVQIDENGPGLGAAPAGLASLGLCIVHDILDRHGGCLAMATSDLGGGCVRVRLPAAPAPDRSDRWLGEDPRARAGL